jgi:hypothetical protein
MERKTTGHCIHHQCEYFKDKRTLGLECVAIIKEGEMIEPYGIKALRDVCECGGNCIIECVYSYVMRF